MMEINRINSPTLFMLLMRRIIQGRLIRLDRWHECDWLIIISAFTCEGERRNYSFNHTDALYIILANSLKSEHVSTLGG